MDETSWQDLVGPKPDILEQQASTYELLTKRIEQKSPSKG